MIPTALVALAEVTLIQRHTQELTANERITKRGPEPLVNSPRDDERRHVQLYTATVPTLYVTRGSAPMEFQSALTLAAGLELADLPSLGPSGFYVLCVESEWNTSPARALRENREAFSAALGHNLLVTLSSASQRSDARELFSVSDYEAPTLLITDVLPHKWTNADQSHGLKIGLGALADYDATVTYLIRVSQTLTNTDPNVFRNLRWRDRAERLRRILEKAPILELVGFFL